MSEVYQVPADRKEKAIVGEAKYRAMYVTLNAACTGNETLRAELVKWVRSAIGPIATPDALQFAPSLP